MSRGKRANVEEREIFIVLVYLERGNLAFDYFAEKAVGSHVSSI